MNRRIGRSAAVLILAAMLGVQTGATAYTQGRAALLHTEEHHAGIVEMNAGTLAAQIGWKPGDESDFSKLYLDRLAAVQAFTDAVEAESAALKCLLIDYDVLLQKLNIQISRYDAIMDKYDALKLQMQVGMAENKELKALKAEAETQIAEVEAVLLEVAAMKTAIEEQTGQPLRTSFNFDSLYYIYDATKINPAAFTDLSELDTICHPEVMTFVTFDPADCADPLAAATELYHALGDAMTLYIEAVEERRDLDEAVKLGLAESAELAEAVRASEDAYLAAYEAKAAYAKSLTELDRAMDGAMIEPLMISRELAQAYKNTIPADVNGGGIWRINRNGASRVFCPSSYPYSAKATDTYTITYNGVTLGSADVQLGIWLSDAEYNPDEPWAYATFYRNGTEIGRYALDIFSPVGTFMSIGD